MTHFFTFSSSISKGSHPQLLKLISLVCIAMFLNNILILLSLDLPVLEIIESLSTVVDETLVLPYRPPSAPSLYFLSSYLSNMNFFVKLVFGAYMLMTMQALFTPESSTAL